MDNPEYTFQILEVFSKVKSKEIPHELEEYLSYVARTGDPVFQWSLVKVLIKEKLLAVLNDFLETCGPIDIPPCPNVDVFNYDAMKEHLMKHLDSFMYPPFTIQRICELLAAPRKEYSRVDKYMRAIEKNVLVVSSSDLSMKRALDADGNDSVINGILYDKVNDSLNNFTNHVFAAAAAAAAAAAVAAGAEEQDDELNVGTKLDETDAVQRIIDESWSEGANDDEEDDDGGGGGGDDDDDDDDNNHQFKLNESNNVNSFEQELQQFVAEKSDAATSAADDEDAVDHAAELADGNLVVDSSSSSSSSSPSSSVSSSSSSSISSTCTSSFADASIVAATASVADTVTLLQHQQQSSLQTILAESTTSLSFENVSALPPPPHTSASTKSDDDFVDASTSSSLKNDDDDEDNVDTYEFNDDNSLEGDGDAEEVAETSTSIAACVDSELLLDPSNESSAVDVDSSVDMSVCEGVAVAEPTIESNVDVADFNRVKDDDQEQEFVDCQTTTTTTTTSTTTTLADQSESLPIPETMVTEISVPSSQDDVTTAILDEPMLECVVDSDDQQPLQTTDSTMADVSSTVESTFAPTEDDPSSEENNPNESGLDMKGDEDDDHNPGESVDEKTFSAGDNPESSVEKSAES